MCPEMFFVYSILYLQVRNESNRVEHHMARVTANIRQARKINLWRQNTLAYFDAAYATTKKVQ
jgi:hypothetical protein